MPVVHRGDEQRPRYARRAPRGEQRPVVRSHVPRAEVLGVDRGHRPETAAVAKQDHCIRCNCPQQRVRAAHQEEHDRLHQEDQTERARGPDPVGKRSPEEAPERVEQRNASECRGDRARSGARELLQDGQRIADQDDPRSHVQEQHRPQQIELPRREHPPGCVGMLPDCGRRFAGRQLALCRVAQQAGR